MDNDTTEMVRCAICGEWHSPEECDILSDGRTVCNGCALEHGGLVRCEHCNKLELKDQSYDATDEGGDHIVICSECEWREFDFCVDCGERCPKSSLQETEKGDWVCDTCIECNGWKACDECGKYIKHQEWYDVDGELLCESCYEDSSICLSCEDCGEVHLRNNMHDVGNSDYYWVCDSCQDNNYAYCDCCDRWVNSDDYDYDRDRCCSCCESEDEQEDEERGCVHDYHWGHHGWIRGPYYLPNEPRKDTLTYGVEIEMAEGSFDYDKMGDGDDMYHFEHDGSLSNGGVELITQPCSLLYHRKEFGWDKILQAAIDCGFKSHKCTSCSCGLHVHIGRKALTDTDELKLDVFFNRYVEWWQHLARRNSSWGEMIGNKSMKYCINDARYRHGDHGRAVNHSNCNTVEIRIAKGTLKCETVLGTIEAYDASIHYLRNVGCYELYNQRYKVWDGFVQYVSSHPKEYPEAIRMMARLGNYRLAKSAVDLLDRKLTKKNDWNKKKECK